MDIVTLALAKNFTKSAVGGLWDKWNTTTQYATGQIVLYNGIPYQKKSGASTQGTFVPSEWTQINISDELEKLQSCVTIVKLTDGNETLAQLSERLATINAEGKHVFFDTSSLNADMYLCTIYIDGTSKYRVTDAVTGKTAIGTYEASKTLATILSEAIADLVTITVTCNTQDGVTVTGQTVTLRNGSATSPIIATKSYNGQPVSFVVAKDTPYYVEATDTLASQYAPSTASGIATSDTSVVITYRSFANVSTFEDVQLLARSGKMEQALAIGKVFNFTKDGTTYPVAVMDFVKNNKTGSIKLKDSNLTNGVIFQTVDNMYALQFDEREAFYCAVSGLVAGVYSFKLGEHTWVSGDVGKTFYFTLTKDIQAGGQLVFKQGYNATLENASLDSFDSATSYTAKETVTMSSTSIAGATYLGELKNSKNGNFNSCQRALFGNSNWSESAIRQHLNSNAPSGDVWTPQNIWDRSPSWRTSTKGFLNGLDSNLIPYIAEVEIDTYLNTVCDGGGLKTTTDKIFLAGRNEIFFTQEGADNGVVWAYYKNGSVSQVPHDNADAIRIKKTNGSPAYWWLRSPIVIYTIYVRYVHPAGASESSGSGSSLGVAPAFVIA